MKMHSKRSLVLSALCCGLLVAPVPALAQAPAPAAKTQANAPAKKRPEPAKPAAPAKAGQAVQATSSVQAVATAPQAQALSPEFIEKNASQLATLEADMVCENLYDSASPMSMALELVQVLGPSFLLSQAPNLTSYSPDEHKKLFESLRSLAKRKVWLPVSMETKIGDYLHERAVSEGQVLAPEKLTRADRNRVAHIQKLLESVLATLPTENPYTVQLGVLEGDQINATVALGGRIYITRGLLRSAGYPDQEIMLMLSHEIGHLTRRHALKDLQIKFIDAMEISRSVKGMVDVSRDPVNAFKVTLGAVNLASLLFQHFDMTQELEGDACGMQLVRKTSYENAHAALRALVQRKTVDGGGTAWEKSHPNYEQREFVMRLQLDDAARLAFGNSRSQMAGRKSDGLPQADLNKLPPTAAGAAPAAPAPKAEEGTGIGGFFNRLRSLVPAGAASAPGTDQPQTGQQ